MSVSTRSQANLRDKEQDLRAQTSHEGPPQGVLPTIRIGALSNQNVPRSDNDIGDVPIPNESVGLNPGSAPPLTLLQQHMDVSELRELVSKLSDNQTSMMDFLQSLIEPHPDRNLDFSHNIWRNGGKTPFQYSIVRIFLILKFSIQIHIL